MFEVGNIQEREREEGEEEGGRERSDRWSGGVGVVWWWSRW